MRNAIILIVVLNWSLMATAFKVDNIGDNLTCSCNCEAAHKSPSYYPILVPAVQAVAYTLLVPAACYLTNFKVEEEYNVRLVYAIGTGIFLSTYWLTLACNACWRWWGSDSCRWC